MKFSLDVSAIESNNWDKSGNKTFASQQSPNGAVTDRENKSAVKENDQPNMRLKFNYRKKYGSN